MKYKKILITGGAGFIGSHTVDALLREGHEVRVFDNLEPQTHKDGRLPEYFNDQAEFIQGDIRDLHSVKKALKDVDVIYHLARSYKSDHF